MEFNLKVRKERKKTIAGVDANPKSNTSHPLIVNPFTTPLLISSALTLESFPIEIFNDSVVFSIDFLKK